jgi:uncharacterized protein YhfF
MVDEKQNQVVFKYWQCFLLTRRKEDGKLPHNYEAWRFGNSPEMADRLGKLVYEGIKTATASLIWWYEEGIEPYPQVGDYSIILDGLDQPICIIQTTELDIYPFSEVPEDHAYLEGEGDRSLRYWREVHWGFFSEECVELGKDPHENMQVLCERFNLVYT